MEVKDYGSNSYRTREKESNANKSGNPNGQERKEKVTTGKVSTKKQSIGKRVSDNLFVEDIKKVKDYLIYDIAFVWRRIIVSHIQ